MVALSRSEFWQTNTMFDHGESNDDHVHIYIYIYTLEEGFEKKCKRLRAKEGEGETSTVKMMHTYMYMLTSYRPGGVGDSKCGGNYAPTILPNKHAMEDHQCDQILWLFNDLCTEVGTSNFFVHWKNEDGVDEVVTAPLDGTILEGVTRQSTIDMLEEVYSTATKQHTTRNM